MTDPLSQHERYLIRATEERLWEQDLVDMLRQALRSRGIQPSPYDSCGDMVKTLEMAAAMRTKERP